jgi:class 3 adenylate cyclase/tetratricopeptide (TPR) repeat protein
MQVCPSCGEENPERFRLCGFCATPLAAPVRPQEERRTVTIVFSDLQGSTALGEALDPEAVREVMSRYFDAMTQVLRRHGGTIEKFIGDAIMAVFGLPRVHEDDALRAVRAAREMQAALAELNDELDRIYGVRLTNRTGVNTGEVVTGDSASAQRLVTGDTVNTAARLEQAAGPNQVLIGELTRRLVRDAARLEPVEPLGLKGKTESVAAYRLVEVTSAAEGVTRRQDTPIVGRDEELATLRATLDDAVTARGARVATIIGDAGVGKSRLVREFVDGVDDRATVLRGRCLPYGEGITFWPLVEAIRDLAGIAADDSAMLAVERLRGLFGDEAVVERIGAVLGVVERVFAIDELTWGIRRGLERLATGRAAVWVIDDIHWAEPTMLDLVRQLGGAVRDHPMVILCTSRHDLLDRHPEWGTELGATRIALTPLDDAASATVVDNLLGSTGIPPQVRDRIVAAAEGNPLFVEQLLGMLIDTARLRQVGDRWETLGAIEEMAVPPTIQALLAARLDLLAPNERAVVEPAAVIGLEFAVDAVVELAAEALAPRVPDHLAAIERKQLIRPAPIAGGDEEIYRFAHILIRDAAYGGLLKRSRAELHERFVAWADRVNAERARGVEYEEILGYHLEQAYRYLGELGPLDAHGRELGERAAERLGDAGRRALLRGDLPAAANLLGRAAATLDPGEARRGTLNTELAEALMDLGRFAEAAAAVDRAETEAAEAGHAAVAARARLARLALRLYTGEDPEWADHVDREAVAALSEFEVSGDEAGQAMAWRLLFARHGTAFRFGEAARAAEQVIAHADAAGDPRLVTRGATGYALAALYGPTPAAEAIERCEELMRLVAGDRRTEALIRSALAQLVAMQGDLARAYRLQAESRAMLEELGGVLSASSSTDSARVALLAGSLTDAERELRADAEALERLGERFLLSTVAGMLARVLYMLDRFDEAEALTRRVEELAAADDTDAQALWRSVRAMTLARRAERDEALRLTDEALALRRGSDAPTRLAEALTDAAEVMRAVGLDIEVRLLREEALAVYEAKGDLVSAGRLRTILS